MFKALDSIVSEHPFPEGFAPYKERALHGVAEDSHRKRANGLIVDLVEFLRSEDGGFESETAIAKKLCTAKVVMDHADESDANLQTLRSTFSNVKGAKYYTVDRALQVAYLLQLLRTKQLPLTTSQASPQEVPQQMPAFTPGAAKKNRAKNSRIQDVVLGALGALILAFGVGYWAMSSALASKERDLSAVFTAGPVEDFRATIADSLGVPVRKIEVNVWYNNEQRGASFEIADTEDGFRFSAARPEGLTSFFASNTSVIQWAFDHPKHYVVQQFHRGNTAVDSTFLFQDTGTLREAASGRYGKAGPSTQNRQYTLCWAIANDGFCLNVPVSLEQKYPTPQSLVDALREKRISDLFIAKDSPIRKIMQHIPFTEYRSPG